MVKTLKRTLTLLPVLLLIFTFTACSGSNTDPEVGTFTINFGGDNARAAYPPNIPEGANLDPDAPKIEDLRFTVIFTSVGGSQLAPFVFEGNGLHRGTVPVGTYNITTEVHLLADNTLYAQGAAVQNPVTIRGGTNNPIRIQLYHPGILMSYNSGPDIPYNNLFDALQAIGPAGSYEIKIGPNQDLAPYTLPTGANITLTSLHAPVTVQLLSNGSIFSVGAGVNLTLGQGITLLGRSGNDSPLVSVTGAGAVLTMQTGSSITGNITNTSNNAGVYVASGGEFTMNGGDITWNNSTAYSGSGVLVDGGGIFTMHNGNISNNVSSAQGGGVVVAVGGAFTMHNGNISNNDTVLGGGGVHIQGDFIMNGGEISGNTTAAAGGGVILASGTFNMAGGEISGNTAGMGGGVYVSTGIFTMSAGEILGNIASSSGGGVYVAAAGAVPTFNKNPTGGTIYGHDPSDAVNSNVAGSFSSPATNMGHAVFVNLTTKRETTVLPGQTLVFGATTSGDWTD